MFLIKIITIILCGIMGRLLASNRIELILEPGLSHMTINCTVHGEQLNSRFSMYLNCPFQNSGICVSNCRHEFHNTITDCKRHINIDSVSVIYKLNTKLINTSGEWYCQYKGQASNKILINKYETTIKMTKSTSISTRNYKQEDTTFSKNNIRHKFSTPELISTKEINFTREPTKKVNEISSSEPTWISFISDQHLTRPEFVLILVIMLGFSLLLNLSFLIRCVLLKSVVDNYHRGITNGPCLLGCLCIEQYSERRRYSRNYNSNHVPSDFYRCQTMPPDNLGIYDDLSAVSNSSARLKMRSNHSSDADEETMLTNLMSNGGCSQFNPIGVGSVSTSLPRRFTSPGHAAYFHPGLGNYVIVSGPIANQDQYTIGTAPPAYAIQMVSPIPSAPGSTIGGGGGGGTNMSVQSNNSDDLLDHLSDHSQTTNSIVNQSIKVNNHNGDIIDPNKIVDLSQTINVRVNGFNPKRPMLINNPECFIRSNGSVPLYSWSVDKVPLLPSSSSSVTSLPQYSISEKGILIQDESQIKDSLLTG